MEVFGLLIVALISLVAVTKCNDAWDRFNYKMEERQIKCRIVCHPHPVRGATDTLCTCGPEVILPLKNNGK